eukprot:362325-Chlamydomonas_euryale.AAC.1
MGAAAGIPTMAQLRAFLQVPAVGFLAGCLQGIVPGSQRPNALSRRQPNALSRRRSMHLAAAGQCP